jgi:uncharacterized protein GlcG (DUF336 family)
MLTLKRLDLSDAHRLTSAARTKASEMGVVVCIAVCDESGVLIAFDRMDDAKGTSGAIAIDKAFAAAGTRKGTHELGAASQPGAPAYGLASAVGGRMVVIGGGIPVYDADHFIGAIGVSGGSPDQDRLIAETAKNALRPNPA